MAGEAAAAAVTATATASTTFVNLSRTGEATIGNQAMWFGIGSREDWSDRPAMRDQKEETNNRAYSIIIPIRQ